MRFLKYYLLISTLVLSTLGFVSPSFACDCDMPDTPALPPSDGRTLEAMKVAQFAVNEYLATVNDYQQCLMGCISDINLHIVDVSLSAEQLVANWKKTFDEYQSHQ